MAAQGFSGRGEGEKINPLAIFTFSPQLTSFPGNAKPPKKQVKNKTIFCLFLLPIFFRSFSQSARIFFQTITLLSVFFPGKFTWPFIFPRESGLLTAAAIGITFQTFQSPYFLHSCKSCQRNSVFFSSSSFLLSHKISRIEFHRKNNFYFPEKNPTFFASHILK